MSDSSARGNASKAVADLVAYCVTLEKRVEELEKREDELIDERNELQRVLNRIEDLGAVREAADALARVAKLAKSLK